VKLEANNEKYEVLQDTLVYWMDAHQNKIKANYGEWMAVMRSRMEALMDASLDTMEACLEKNEVNFGKVAIKMEVETEDRYGDQHLAVRTIDS
jgi:hypothetical protein